MPKWAEDKLSAALDLHCPHIAGKHSEVIYLVGSRRGEMAREQRRFSDLLERVNRGPLPFFSLDFLPFGTAWNTEANYAGGTSFSQWLAALPGISLATSLELPYASAGGREVNQETAKAFGIDLALALRKYLA